MPRRIAALALSLLLLGCDGAEDRTAVAATPSTKPAGPGPFRCAARSTSGCTRYAVTVRELTLWPQRYHGKAIRVVGRPLFQWEQFVLYSDGEPEPGAVWLNAGLPPGQSDPLEGKRVVVEGVFDAKDRGHLDSYPGAISQVSRIELEQQE